MKLLVFAHTPPPHHGQSYMVKLMLEGFGGDARKQSAGERAAAAAGPGIQCFHVNCRFSNDMEDIGEMRFGKAVLVLRYCLEAIWCRFRYGVRKFYYVPAPGKRAALYRDWMVMLLCRPFFKDFFFHWHAVGLGDWLVSEGNFFERWVTHRLLSGAEASVVLAVPSMRDALWFRTRRVEVVPNCIPDPCPGFDTEILPRRLARVEARRRLLDCGPGATENPDARFRVLFIAHCTREKGVFDAIEGVLLANETLRQAGSPLRMELHVAGAFLDAGEEAEFREILERPECRASLVYEGFVSGEAKTRLFAESDCLCFPTYYNAESFGLVIVEALAFGLPVVTTRWRAIPEILPPQYPFYVPPQSPSAIAGALERLLTAETGTELRARFLATFTVAGYLERLARAFEARG